MSRIEGLRGVPETLLIPLAARALAHRRHPRMRFRDREAERIAEEVQVDFDRYAADGRSVRGVIARSRWFDRVCLEFLARHPEPTFVSLGSGLNTMYERLRSAAEGRRFRWIDSDLPEVVSLRRTIFPDDSLRTTIELDLADPNVFDRVDVAESRALMLVAEGLVMYLSPEAAVAVFRDAARCFAAARALCFAFDYASPSMVARSRQHAALRKIKDDSVAFQWGLPRAKDLAAIDLRWTVLEESSAPMTCAGPLPAAIEAVHRILTGRRFYACALLERVAASRDSQGETPGSP
ncbi:hypothetical protein MYXO_03541 [Myxococcaceae bacterium]|nr:hypothetical protein MYXO_03541 [Myxococcaceae bacterium]